MTALLYAVVAFISVFTLLLLAIGAVAFTMCLRFGRAMRKVRP